MRLLRTSILPVTAAVIIAVRYVLQAGYGCFYLFDQLVQFGGFPVEVGGDGGLFGEGCSVSR